MDVETIAKQIDQLLADNHMALSASMIVSEGNIKQDIRVIPIASTPVEPITVVPVETPVAEATNVAEPIVIPEVVSSDEVVAPMDSSLENTTTEA